MYQVAHIYEYKNAWWGTKSGAFEAKSSVFKAECDVFKAKSSVFEVERGVVYLRPKVVYLKKYAFSIQTFCKDMSLHLYELMMTTLYKRASKFTDHQRVDNDTQTLYVDD